MLEMLNEKCNYIKLKGTNKTYLLKIYAWKNIKTSQICKTHQSFKVDLLFFEFFRKLFQAELLQRLLDASHLIVVVADGGGQAVGRSLERLLHFRFHFWFLPRSWFVPVQTLVAEQVEQDQRSWRE